MLYRARRAILGGGGGGGATDPDAARWARDIVAQGAPAPTPIRLHNVSLFFREEKQARIFGLRDYCLLRGQNDTQRKTSLRLRLHSVDVGAVVLNASIGAYFDGTTAQNTNFVPLTHMASGNDMGLNVFGVYDNRSAGVVVGCRATSTSNLEYRLRNGDTTQGRVNSNDAILAGSLVGDSRYFGGISRTAAGVTEFWRTGASIGTASPTLTTPGVRPNIPLWIGGRNDNGVIASTYVGWVSFVSMGASLTAAQQNAHNANVARLIARLDQEYLVEPAQSPLLAYAGLGVNYTWPDVTDPAYLYTDEAMTTLVQDYGDPVRWVYDRSGLGNHARVERMNVPCHFWGDGTGRQGVKIGPLGSGGSLIIPSMDLSATNKVSVHFAGHRWDRQTVKQLFAIDGPVAGVDAPFVLSARVGYGADADPRDLNAEFGDTPSGPTYTCPQLIAENAAGENDFVYSTILDRDGLIANTANRRMKFKCNNVDGVQLNPVGGSSGTGNLSSTSVVRIGGRPVTGGTFLNQEFDAPVTGFALAAGRMSDAAMAAITNYFMPRTRTELPGIQSFLIGSVT